MHLPSQNSIKQSCVPLSGSMYAQIFKTTQQILMRFILIDGMIQEEGLYVQFITLETRAKLRSSASLFNNIIRLKSEHFVNDRTKSLPCVPYSYRFVPTGGAQEVWV